MADYIKTNWTMCQQMGEMSGSEGEGKKLSVTEVESDE